MAEHKLLKVGVRRGGGPPPGYRRTVVFVTVSRDEALDGLDDDEVEYHHLADQFKDLASQENLMMAASLAIEGMEDNLYVLKDSRGPLGDKTVGVFFSVYDQPEPMIVVLATKFCELDEGFTFIEIMEVRRRQRSYEEGNYGSV